MSELSDFFPRFLLNDKNGYALACAGPLLFGVLRQHSGGWAAPFTLLAGASTVVLVAGWLACRPQQLEDQWLQATPK